MRCESANAILPFPLGGDGYVSSWLQVQVSKEQTGFDTRSCDQTFAKKQRHSVLILTFGMWTCVADFLPSYMQILLQFFQLCTGDLAGFTSWARASYIYLWMVDIITRRKWFWQSSIHCTALLLPGSDIRLRSWPPLVVKYPIAAVIRKDGINHILQPNLDMTISSQAPLESSFHFGKISCVLNITPLT